MKIFTDVMVCLCCVFFLVSCVNNKKNIPVTAIDLIDLTAKSSYQFTGKMSFSDGEEGGSGQVGWYLDQPETKLVLKAPLSNKSWELVEFSDGAQITLSDGDKLLGVSAQSLISDQLGWEVPWNALKLWVIGKKTPKGKAVFVEEGMQFFDQGWQITYSQFKPYEDKVLPYKITARKGNYSIKLIVKQWRW